MDKKQSRKLDQFYTSPIYAQEFVATIKTQFDLDLFDILLEPSAGTGSFYNLLSPDRRVGLDLDPKYPGIIETDFFDWKYPSDKKIITIGNPPFGKNANLAVKFFNYAATFSEVIAFILPCTFRKSSIINRLNCNFHNVYDVTAPKFSFVFNDKPYDVWCCAQIWVKKDVKRPITQILMLKQVKDWFELVPPDDADFAIQRVGGRAGLIRTFNFKTYSAASHYFIKSHHPDVLDVFKKIDFNTVKFNTAGNPSVSPGELTDLWVTQAKAHGLKVLLDSNTFAQHFEEATQIVV